MAEESEYRVLLFEIAIGSLKLKCILDCTTFNVLVDGLHLAMLEPPWVLQMRCIPFSSFGFSESRAVFRSSLRVKNQRRSSYSAIPKLIGD